MSDEAGTIQKFTGKELDDEHGIDLYYFGARYHDPVNGRFISVDPLAEENAGWSPYSYSKNNPLNRIDPDGHNDRLAQLAAYFSAENRKTANDYNNFASSRIVIPQAAIDQSGAETFADAVQFLNDSAEPGRLDTAEGLGRISDVTAKASAVRYTDTLLATPAPPVSTALAFAGMVVWKCEKRKKWLNRLNAHCRFILIDCRALPKFSEARSRPGACIGHCQKANQTLSFSSR